MEKDGEEIVQPELFPFFENSSIYSWDLSTLQRSLNIDLTDLILQNTNSSYEGLPDKNVGPHPTPKAI
jgi:hypothetical protein